MLHLKKKSANIINGRLDVLCSSDGERYSIALLEVARALSRKPIQHDANVCQNSTLLLIDARGVLVKTGLRTRD